MMITIASIQMAVAIVVSSGIALSSGMRCNGQDNGCCTNDTPCYIGEGDCDYDHECTGSLVCGHLNCPWGDGDSCCEGTRCTGQDSGCCTKDTPCNRGEGDCDNDQECSGKLVCGTNNCPWGDDDDCCMSATYECKFVVGDGTGVSDRRIGSQTGSDCAEACMNLKKTDSTINGVTSSNRGCWCEKGMRSINKGDRNNKACFLKPEAAYECKFVVGDGTGASDERVGSQKGSDCAEACMKLKTADSTINGVTFSNSGCWCEKEMRSINKGDKKNKACFLKG